MRSLCCRASMPGRNRWHCSAKRDCKNSQKPNVEDWLHAATRTMKPSPDSPIELDTCSAKSKEKRAMRARTDPATSGGETRADRLHNNFNSKVGGRGAILFGAVLFASVAVGLHGAQGQTQPSAPETLKPPAGERLRAHAHASGQQIYTCDGSKWILSGPDAKLFDKAGQKVGSHFAGPTWQWSDGSRVTGRPIASADLDPESIPWLLLTATGHTGDGVMKNVSSIQRLQTKGGKAPAKGCELSHIGEQARISYAADYYFYASQE